jgi:hypothetical protein
LKVYVPAATAVVVLIVIRVFNVVLLAVANVAGLKLAVAPVGRPEALIVMLQVVPPLPVVTTLTELAAVVP